MIGPSGLLGSQSGSLFGFVCLGFFLCVCVGGVGCGCVFVFLILFIYFTIVWNYRNFVMKGLPFKISLILIMLIYLLNFHGHLC